MRVIAPIPKQFVDSNGVPYANGKVTVYLHNSTTRAQIYKEAEGDVLAPNPTILDSHGAWNAFVTLDTAYDYVVQDEHDNVIFPYSNVSVSGLGAAAESIYEIAMFDLSQAGHNLYGDIDSYLGKGLLPIIAAGSQGLVRYYYYTARDSQAHTMTFTCGYNGSVELLVLKDDDTYTFKKVGSDYLIAKASSIEVEETVVEGTKILKITIKENSIGREQLKNAHNLVPDSRYLQFKDFNGNVVVTLSDALMAWLETEGYTP